MRSARSTLSWMGLASAVMCAGQAQTIINGDFEDVSIASKYVSKSPADVPGWVHSGAPGDELLYHVGATDSHGTVTAAGHGEQFVALGGGYYAFGTASWSTTISGLLPGVSYVVSFMISNEGEVPNQSLTVTFPTGCLGSCKQTFTTTAPPSAPIDSSHRLYWKTWEPESIAFIAAGTTATIQFSANHEQYDVGLDYVKVAVGSAATANAPFAIPNGPSGPGPLGDPAAVNCVSCGQPVTVSNGNMFHQFTDLRLGSRGFPIALTRTYNSQAGVSGVFGNGWTHNYQRWLYSSGTSVVYYNESGGAYTFTAQPSGFAAPPGFYMTLARQMQGTFQLQTPDGDVMSFDDKGRLTGLADTNGNAQTISYNPQGNISAVADGAGAMLTFSYDATGHVTAVQDNAGRRVTYTYDASGNLTGSTDPAGARTTYAYTPASAGALLQTITFADGGTINYTYDPNKRVTQVTDRGGAKNQFAYSAGQTVLQDELGAATSFQFNPSGNVTKRIKPDGTFTLQGFDSNTRLTSYTDENGASTSYQYDSRGNLLKRTDALGGVWQFAWDPQFRRITQLTDANHNATQYQYDTKGNLLKTVDALGGQRAFTYDSFGNVISSTDPAGAAFSTAWDARGNPVAVTDALGNTTQLTYDNLNRLVQIKDTLNATSTLQYDALGRLTQSTDPLGRTFARVYDALGRVIRATDAAGSTTSFNYDTLGNLTKVTDALGGVAAYSWSAGACNCSTAGTLSSITNAAGQPSSFTYNSNRRVSRATGAAEDSTQFSYDPAGNPVQRTDANGAAINLAFDPLHRLTQRQFPDGTADSFTYDANGNRLTATNQYVTLTYTYDALNRVTSVSDSRFPAPIVYAYDKSGRRSSMTDPYGGQTVYTYDANGRLTALASPNGTTTTFTYDADGRRSGIIMGNGIVGAYARDAAGQLVSLCYSAGAAAVDQFSYTFDNAGNRLSMTTPAGVHTYQYDALYRLTGATHPNDPAESYSYDAAGNRVSAAAPSTSSSGSTSYNYDALNRLVAVTLPDQSLVTYKYDPFGRRIEKNVGGTVTRYLYDGNNVVLEQDDSGAPFQARYSYGPRIDEPLIMEYGGGSYYYLADGSGNIVDLTDGSGAIVQSYDADSFGQLTSPAGPVPNPYIFAGRAWDAETGLYYFRSRYYDPETGRFTTQDSWSPAMLLAAAQAGSGMARQILNSYLRTPALLNAYAYAVNNPINRSDPYGTDPIDTSGADPGAFVDDPGYVPYAPAPDEIAAATQIGPIWIPSAAGAQAIAAGAASAMWEAAKNAANQAWEAIKNAFWNFSTNESPIPLIPTSPQDVSNTYQAFYESQKTAVLTAAASYGPDRDADSLVNQIQQLDARTDIGLGVKVILLNKLLNDNSDVLNKIGVQRLHLPDLPNFLKCQVK